MIEVLVLTSLLLGIAFAGIAIKLLIDKKAVFKGSSCSATPDGLKDQGVSCGCGGGHCVNAE